MNLNRKNFRKVAAGLALVLGGLDAKAIAGTEEALEAYRTRMEEVAGGDNFGEHFTAPSVNEMAQAAYGVDSISEKLYKAQNYRQEHPEIPYLAEYTPENLEAKTPAQKTDLFGGSGRVVFISELGGVSRKILIEQTLPDAHFSAILAHEAAHAGVQLPGKGILCLQAMQREGLALAREDWENSKNTGENYDELVRMQGDMVTPIEVEVRAIALKRLAEGGLGMEINTPYDSLKALQMLGFSMNKEIVDELFINHGFAKPQGEVAAFSPQLLEKIDAIHPDLADTRKIINGTVLTFPQKAIDAALAEGEEPPSPVVVPPAGKEVQRRIIEGLIFQTPGLVNNQQNLKNLGGIA